MCAATPTHFLPTADGLADDRQIEARVVHVEADRAHGLEVVLEGGECVPRAIPGLVDRAVDADEQVGAGEPDHQGVRARHVRRLSGAVAVSFSAMPDCCSMLKPASTITKPEMLR